ncbi:MAG: UbiD family decarboxylase [Anaerolineales bacterium]
MDLRTFLAQLEVDGELHHVTAPTSPHLEVARAIASRDGEPLLFESLLGYPGWRLVSGYVAQRAHFARALGCEISALVGRMTEALESPREAPLVQEAPCQEVVEADVDLTRLPIPRYHALDGGPYVTAGVVVTQDPQLGRNLAFHRMMLRDERHFTVRVVERRGTDSAWRGAPEGLPIAVCIGLPPHLLLAAAMSPAPGVDESAVGQALAPTPLVQARTAPLQIPSEAELVLEGVLTHELGTEGPFPDLTGTMDVVRRQPVFRVEAVTHRRDPVFHALLPAGLEHRNLMGMPREPTIYAEVNRVTRCTGVYITPGGCSWLHAVVQIEPQGPEDARKALAAAFRGHGSLKRVTVVDRDVDVYDPLDVEWAVATRVQARRDLYIFPDEPSSSLDPSARQVPGEKARSDKVGVDATIPWGEPREGYLRVIYDSV